MRKLRAARTPISILLASLLVFTLVPAVALAEPSNQAAASPEREGAAAVVQNLAPIGSDEDLEKRLPTGLPSAQALSMRSTQDGASLLDDRAQDVQGVESIASVEKRPSSTPATEQTGTHVSHPTSLGCGSPHISASPEDVYAALAANAAKPRAYSETSYQAGDVRTFYSEERANTPTGEFEITCVATGEGYTLWIDQENRGLIPEADLQDFAARLPSIIADEVEIFGDWRTLGDVDNDGKAAFVFYPFARDSWGGFFASADLLPASEEYATGNTMDVLHLNIFNKRISDDLPPLYDADSAMPVIVHELQHLISFAQTGGEYDSWLGEAFSQAAVSMLGMATESNFNGLAYGQREYGYVPPFIFEGNYVPDSTTFESEADYGLWLLFGRYLASQTENFSGGGDQIYKTILNAPVGNGTSSAACTRESLESALVNIGYMGEGCTVRDFDTLISNFGLAYLLREDTGVHSLTGDPRNPSNVGGVDVPLVSLLAQPETIPGGGAMAAIDLDSTTSLPPSQNTSAGALVYSTVYPPLAVGAYMQRTPQGSEFFVGDLITVSLSDARAQMLTRHLYEDGSFDDSPDTTNPFIATEGRYCLVARGKVDRGMTSWFSTPLLTVRARPEEKGEEVPEVPPEVLPEESGTKDISQGGGALAQVGDPLSRQTAHTLALGILALLSIALARLRYRKNYR